MGDLLFHYYLGILCERNDVYFRGVKRSKGSCGRLLGLVLSLMGLSG